MRSFLNALALFIIMSSYIRGKNIEAQYYSNYEDGCFDVILVGPNETDVQVTLKGNMELFFIINLVDYFITFGFYLA